MFDSQKFKTEELRIEDPYYPDLLKSIPNPPRSLYLKGNFYPELFSNCLGIVGSRKVSLYGKKVINTYVRRFVHASLTIVSGFMYGVDALAHAACLMSGGKTVAVMPCGIDKIHPESQSELYYEILAKGGLIVSEDPGDVEPQPWSYPRRNRIVAGLSRAVLVVEAGVKSGSVITACFAQKYKRSLFAVPGSIFSEVSQGTNNLLKNGALPATDTLDVLKVFNYTDNRLGDAVSVDEVLDLSKYDEITIKIYFLLKTEPLTLEEIASELDIQSNILSQKITLMIMDGLLCEDSGRYYAG